MNDPWLPGSPKFVVMNAEGCGHVISWLVSAIWFQDIFMPSLYISDLLVARLLRALEQLVVPL